MSVNVRPVSKELQERATKDLNEDPSRIAEDIQHIKSWLDKQPHLTAIRDDQWILTFLRGCKFSLEKTKEKMDLFYTIRSMIPEVYSNRDPLESTTQEILKLGLCLPLPGTTQEGRKVFLMKLASYDPGKFDFPSVIKISTLFQDLGLYTDDEMVINGVIIVVDARNMSMSHVAQYHPGFIRKFVNLMQKGYPIRPKGIYFINCSSIFETAYNLFSPFLNEKMISRVRILSSGKIEDLYELIPKRMLPAEYGGDAGRSDMIINDFQNNLMKNRDWLIESSKTGSNESKRPGRPKTSEDLFGIDGSFRKLNVD